MISGVFTLSRSKRPHGEESLPLSNWIIPQEESESGTEGRRERQVVQRVGQYIIFLWSWMLQAAGQEMRRRTPTDLQPLAASQPIIETI